MLLTRWPCVQEIHEGPGVGGTLLQADTLEIADTLLEKYAGTVQCVYMDPPFFTGQRFMLRMCVGEAEWRKGLGTLPWTAYEDTWPSEAVFLSMMERVLRTAYHLLRPDGSLFLHIDARMNAQLRLLLNDIFGDKQFANEIIWAYQSGGRSTRHFSRKHDTILFYRKSAKAYFNIKNVAVPRGQYRANHMKQSVDEEGRAYRSITSGGKEYRYYDDDPVYPGDVWDDVSHLQQRDPQRTGYDTQKPLKLLERIILCSTRPGDLVADLFLGSGTTAAAAALHGRAFLGVDSSNASMLVSRKRLLPYAFTQEVDDKPGMPEVHASRLTGVSTHEITLDAYIMENGVADRVFSGLDAVDQWSVGYVRGDAFHAMADTARSRAVPALDTQLEIPVLSGHLALCTVDVVGRHMIHLF